MSDNSTPKRFVYAVTFGDIEDFDGSTSKEGAWQLTHTCPDLYESDTAAMNAVWAEAERAWTEDFKRDYPHSLADTPLFPGIIYKHGPSNERTWFYRIRNQELLPFCAIIHLCEVKR